MDNKKTGALIAARRQELGLTQKQLAEQLNVSDRTISKWERGAGFPDVSLLEPLADVLDLSILELIHGERMAPEEQPSPEAERSARSAAYALGRRFGRTAIRLRNALAVLGVLFLVLLAAACFLNSVNGSEPRTASAGEALALCPYALITQEEYELAEQLRAKALELENGASENLEVPAELLSINGDPARLLSLSLSNNVIFVNYADHDLGIDPNRQCFLTIWLDGSPTAKTAAEYGENGLLYSISNIGNENFTIYLYQT